MTACRCPWCRQLRRRDPGPPPGPPPAVPYGFTRPGMAEGVALVAARRYGIDPLPPDPDVPPADVTAALAAMIAAILGGLPPGNAEKMLAAFGRFTTPAQPEGEGEDHG